MLGLARLSWVGALQCAICIIRKRVLAGYGIHVQPNVIRAVMLLESPCAIDRWMYRCVLIKATAI